MSYRRGYFERNQESLEDLIDRDIEHSEDRVSQLSYDIFRELHFSESHEFEIIVKAPRLGKIFTLTAKEEDLNGCACDKTCNVKEEKSGGHSDQVFDATTKEGFEALRKIFEGYFRTFKAVTDTSDDAKEP